MADPDPNPAPNPSPSPTPTHAVDYERVIAELRGRIKELNGENAGHRLNSDRFRTDADGLREQLKEAKGGLTAATEAVKAEAAALIEAERAKLEEDRGALTNKLTEAEKLAAAAQEKARNRSIRADLRVAAREAGMVDLDGLALLDMSKVIVNDDGDVANAADLMAKLKESKAYLFGKSTTSNPDPAPAPNPPGEKRVSDMTPAERKIEARKLGISF